MIRAAVLSLFVLSGCAMKAEPVQHAILECSLRDGTKLIINTREWEFYVGLLGSQSYAINKNTGEIHGEGDGLWCGKRTEVET